MLFVSPARDRARLGMIIARKNLASAVQRNRLKRVIRSRCELMIDQEAASLNLVFLLRRKVSDIRQLQLEKEIEGLLARIKSA